jgi:hypothetical protein
VAVFRALFDPGKGTVYRWCQNVNPAECRVVLDRSGLCLSEHLHPSNFLLMVHG